MNDTFALPPKSDKNHGRKSNFTSATFNSTPCITALPAFSDVVVVKVHGTVQSGTLALFVMVVRVSISFWICLLKTATDASAPGAQYHSPDRSKFAEVRGFRLGLEIVSFA